MLICKIYSKTGEELVSMPITHFTERMRQDNELELSCLFRVHTENASNEMDQYLGIVGISLGKISFFKDEVLIVEYEKYNKVSGVQVDYGAPEFTGMVTFTP